VASFARRLIIWKTSNRVIALSVSRSPLCMLQKSRPLVSLAMPSGSDIRVQIALKAWMAGHFVPAA
jgi:hypothetical protein